MISEIPDKYAINYVQDTGISRVLHIVYSIL